MIFGNIDGATQSQYFSAVKEGYVKKSALMPDAHLGYSVPIGSVLACEGAVVPAWVGYDIGCGMFHARLSLSLETLQQYQEDIFQRLRDNVPVREKEGGTPWTGFSFLSPLAQRVYRERGGDSQLGTIGSGNHFVELGTDDQSVFLTIHTGSRGFGHGLASEWMALASGSHKPLEGHYPIFEYDRNFSAYIRDMQSAIAYSKENRERLASCVVDVLSGMFRERIDYLPIRSDLVYVNAVHNTATLENGLWVHRKGATIASKGTYGVIPGNQRDGVFLVRGLGNEDGLDSCSHGAGRQLSRKQANKLLDLGQEERKMGTISFCKGKLDEAPGAYKDVYEVLEAQKALVKVISHVEPLVNLKG